MSVIRFPYEPESSHPQYLWNEHEYVVRMLTQNKIGIGLREDNYHGHISGQGIFSMGNIAMGMSEIILPNIYFSFPTDFLSWVYCKRDGSEFYQSTDKPSYNTILQGWFHPATEERAVVFVDFERSPGQRCIIMDSFNSMFDYDHRIGDPPAGELVFPKNAAQEAWSTMIPHVLQPGSYRFEMKGGRGGSGGNLYNDTYDTDPRFNRGWSNGLVRMWRNIPQPALSYRLFGGKGAAADTYIFKITLLTPVTIYVYRGADGENGGGDPEKTGACREVTEIIGPPILVPGGMLPHYADNVAVDRISRACSAGGGASGEDSRIIANERDLFRAIGGAGGGGAGGASETYIGPFLENFGMLRNMESIVSGGGGGGAGSGVAEDGQIVPEGTGSAVIIPMYNDPRIVPGITPARKGTINLGGAGSQGTRTIWANGQSLNEIPCHFWPENDGMPGQNINEGYLRKGGDSPPLKDPILNQEYTMKGGQKAKHDMSDGFVRIYKV